jgi:uncharacterized protein YndB with AHSA1/START domain
MTPSNVGPVQRRVVVNLGIERAFQLFIERFDAIKPRDHNLLSVPIAKTVFEPREGGHIFDVGVDGSQCRWSRVLTYQPPHRVVFSWDIGPTWQLETDLQKTSEVEVRFIAESDTRTRVELEHRNLDRHGDGWRSVADGISGEGGWPLYLRRYTEIVAEVLQ